jgi:phytoene synthase
MIARDCIQRHSRTFASAARLLPARIRSRAEALYAWCRLADDLIDDAQTADDAARLSAQLRAEVVAVYAGHSPNTPTAQALAEALRLCSIPIEYPLELIAGFEMDARGVRYDRTEDLLLYCYRVAGVVGLMMCSALEVRSEDAKPFAIRLGIAMQLTNIARDVAEDWSRGRLYLAREWFLRAPDLSALLVDECVAPAIARCLDLADAYYASAEPGLRYLSPRCRLAIRLAARCYQAIGRAIAARGYRATSGRAVVSRGHKIRLLASVLMTTLQECITPRVHPDPRIEGAFSGL